jgi:hypothetical protein
MKRKLLFTGMILLALALTTGTFAYTYPGAATAKLDATVADEDMTTYELSADQPDWDKVLPDSEYNSEILVPNAAGDETDIPFQSPSSGEHWDKVDDQPADNGATYVANMLTGAYRRDLYNLTDYLEVEGYDDINSVRVYFRFAGYTDGGDHIAYARPAIKTHGAIFEGNQVSQTGGTYVTKSHQWTVNPATKKVWTWEDINALQAGISLRSERRFWPAYCTQVYVAVDYESVITEGEVPEGELYNITPHPEYNGDLLVKLYLTNTGALNKAYKYLNMKIYIKNSLEAEKRPKYQILSMENGVAMFNIEGGSAESYTIEVFGGSYRLMSADINQWGEGWSITPELYLEVAQR